MTPPRYNFAAVPHMSALQKKDHIRILRGNLPPEVEKRIRAREREAVEAAKKAAADTARSMEEAAAKAAEEYKRTLPERMRREQQERFMANAEKFS